MPLTSGVARGVRQLRTDLAQRLREHWTMPVHAIGWSKITISMANAQAIVEQFRAQNRISEIPVGRKMLIELYRDDTFTAITFFTRSSDAARMTHFRASWRGA